MKPRSTNIRFPGPGRRRWLLALGVASLGVGPPVPAEGFRSFQPEGSVRLVYDTNPRRVPDERAREDAAVLTDVKLPLTLHLGKHTLDVAYDGNYGIYARTPDLAYDDHALRARLLLDHRRALTTEVTAAYKRGHEEPGSTDALGGVTDASSTVEDQELAVKVTVGQPESRGQLIAGVRGARARYAGAESAFRDQDEVRGSASFFYRVAPKTRLVLDTGVTRTTTDHTRTVRSVLLGVDWRATATLTGVFKAGYFVEDSGAPGAPKGVSGLALSIDGAWRPSARTQLTFGATRDTQTSAVEGRGTFINTDYRLGLSHELTARTRLTGKAGYGTDDFGDALEPDRRTGLELGITHSLRRRFDIGAQYRYEARASELPEADFTSHAVLLLGRARLR